MLGPHRRHHQRGAAAVELAAMSMFLPMLWATVLGPDRSTTAGIDVDGAAYAAARAASLARTADGAKTAAAYAAASALDVGAVTCRHLSVAVDTSSFHPGGGVTVTVSCDLDLSDLAEVNLPGSIAKTAAAWSSIDKHRAVSP